MPHRSNTPNIRRGARDSHKESFRQSHHLVIPAKAAGRDCRRVPRPAWAGTGFAAEERSGPMIGDEL